MFDPPFYDNYFSWSPFYSIIFTRSPPRFHQPPCELNNDNSLKLDYTKFGVSNLFFSKVIEEKPLGCRPNPPPPLPGKGRINTSVTCNFLCLDIFI